MLDETINSFFEEDDECFAEAFGSLTDVETPLLKNASLETTSTYENTSKKQDTAFHSELLSFSDEDNEVDASPDIFGSCCTIDHRSQTQSQANMLNFPSVKDDVNYRFLPGYSSKIRKRILPDPFGIFRETSPIELCMGYDSEDSDVDISEVSSSQFTRKHLFKTVSWNKLEEEVSSNKKLLPTVQSFSIEKVLSEASKKKLPKHIVVPILCLYIKEYDSKKPLSLYMDDTGDITGRVDKESLHLYKSHIKTGTSLILRKIVFICNVMLLDKSNFVSFYLEDGSVKHILNWEMLIDNELSNSPTFIFPTTPKALERPTKQNLGSKSKVNPLSGDPLNDSVLAKTVQNNNFQQSHSSSCTETSSICRSISNDAANRNEPHVEMDDNFDELLSNLDENSFFDDF